MLRSVLLIPLALAALAAQAAAQAPAKFALHTCEIRAAQGVQSDKARCGTLTVPLNRDRPDGKQIELHVAVLAARASQPAPDPLFFIAGGPGMGAIDGYFSEPGAFDAVREHRDIVLVDQRGTGRSHPLECPQPETPPLKEPGAAARRALVAACLKQLKADPRYFTTTVAVRDLDAVRAALGYGQIDLYGISYGTRVALQYLRAYPQHTRAVILDGVVPPTLALGPQVSVNAARALDLIFARCRADATCRQRFPHLPATFKTLNRQLARQPMKVRFPDPLTAQPIDTQLTQSDVADAVRLLSYANETTSLLPLLIWQAAVAHDYQPLAALATLVGRDLADSMSDGMSLSVLCTEDVPFYSPQALEAAAAQHTYVGGRAVDQLETACSVWPRGVLAPHFKDPVVSAKPVLLISGADDPITPPRNAARVAAHLRNSLSLVIGGQGHGNAFRGCVPRLMADFLTAAAVSGLHTGCIKAIRPAPFFLNPTGPAP